MKFEKVINGIMIYMNREIYSGMNEWQEILARIAVSRIIGDEAKLKETLMTNSFVRTFLIMDDEGNIDVEGLMGDLKKQIEQKGKLTIAVPMFGNFTFVPEDVDKLYRAIQEA